MIEHERRQLARQTQQARVDAANVEEKTQMMIRRLALMEKSLQHQLEFAKASGFHQPHK